MTSLTSSKRLVVKIGSSILVDEAKGEIRRDWLDALTRDVAALHRNGCEIVLVSSGAIRLGRTHLKLPHALPLAREPAHLERGVDRKGARVEALVHALHEEAVPRQEGVRRQHAQRQRIVEGQDDVMATGLRRAHGVHAVRAGVAPRSVDQERDEHRLVVEKGRGPHLSHPAPDEKAGGRPPPHVQQAGVERFAPRVSRSMAAEGPAASKELHTVLVGEGEKKK